MYWQDVPGRLCWGAKCADGQTPGHLRPTPVDLTRDLYPRAGFLMHRGKQKAIRARGPRKNPRHHVRLTSRGHRRTHSCPAISGICGSSFLSLTEGHSATKPNRQSPPREVLSPHIDPREAESGLRQIEDHRPIAALASSHKPHPMTKHLLRLDDSRPRDSTHPLQ